MRILAIQPFLGGYTINPYAGGKNKVALRLAQHLVKNGHEVHVPPWWGERILDQTRFRLGDGDTYATALPTVHFPTGTEFIKSLPRLFLNSDLPRHPLRRLAAFLREVIFNKETAVKRAMDLVKPDVVHVHQTHSDFPRIYRRLGYTAPLLLTHHTGGRPGGRPSAFLNEYDFVVFPSRHLQLEASEAEPSIINRSTVIHYFVDDEYRVRTIPSLPDRSGSIVCVGALKVELKGLGVLLDAYLADPTLNRWRLMVIGDGPLRAKYEESAVAHDLNVSFCGRLPNVEVADLMASARLFVMPSLREGLALAYLEALCLGLPIVGYPPNVEELSEILGIKVGLSYDPSRQDESYLAELIKQAMDSEKGFDEDHRSELALRACQYFTLGRFTSEYINIYDNLAFSK